MQSLELTTGFLISKYIVSKHCSGFYSSKAKVVFGGNPIDLFHEYNTLSSFSLSKISSLSR